MLSNNRSINQ